MIVEKSFIEAISYAKKHDIMVRPEYWSPWIRYIKNKAGFFWCDKDGIIIKSSGLDKNVTVCDKVLDVTKWEFMCDELVDDAVSNNE